jgi:GT2 family glycosyltransferase
MVISPQRFGAPMLYFVVVATKGRPQDVARLLDRLASQELPPACTVVVGTEEGDVAVARSHASVALGAARLLVSAQAGSSAQRNVGVDVVKSLVRPDQAYFVAFMDDDYRPASDWGAEAQRLFASDPSIVGLTGRVLADGVRGPGLEEAEADAYLRGSLPPAEHWTDGPLREIDCGYGCNMAFVDKVIERCTFDENLPLYGWQEDQDYTSNAIKHGRMLLVPSCRGVHLGRKNGRTSGTRFGYSQVINPLYLMRKGTMSPRKGTRFVLRALAANVVRSVRPNPLIDYRGRLRGNAIALADLLRGRAHPARILAFR